MKLKHFGSTSIAGGLLVDTNVNDRADIVCLGTVVMDIFSDFRNHDAPPGMQKSRQISQAAFSQVVF